MTVSAIAERYVGRRVVLVVGGTTAVGDAVERPLVAAGVEVHVVSDGTVGRQPGVASWTVCELGSIDAVGAAIEHIGAVVQDLFCCWPGTEAVRVVVETVEPLMHVGGSIVVVDPVGPEVEEFVATRAADLAAAGIRLVSATADGALAAGAPGLA